MCGRYGFAKPKEEVKKRFGLKKLPKDLPQLYNIAPQQDIPVILNESPTELSFAKWGLVPHWAKEGFKLNLINAKSETIAEKPIFKSLLKTKRCLVPADFFYEWQKKDGKKVPYRILLKDEGIFSFAGIWDTSNLNGKQFISCCILTTAPNSLMAPIHDRMPVILKPQFEQAWLTAGESHLPEMFHSYDANLMKAYPISTKINSPTNNSADLILPV